MSGSGVAAAAQVGVDQVLLLLRDKVVLGRGLPDHLVGPPWRLCGHADADAVNAVLEHSMRAQAATVGGSGNFEDFVVSNANLAVSGLLKVYLGALAPAAAEDAHVTLGVLRWDPEAREDEDDFEGTPYVWLDVHQQPIDNVYVHIPKEENRPSHEDFPGQESFPSHEDYFYKVKNKSLYLKEDPLNCALRLYYGSGGSQEVRHNLKMYKNYANDQHIEKFLAASLGNAELNPGLRFYDYIMRDFLVTTLKVDSAAVDVCQKWSSRCWDCGREGNAADLKTCTGCRSAKYCERKCQQQDWKRHKLLHEELEMVKSAMQKTE